MDCTTQGDGGNVATIQSGLIARFLGFVPCMRADLGSALHVVDVSSTRSIELEDLRSVSCVHRLIGVDVWVELYSGEQLFLARWASDALASDFIAQVQQAIVRVELNRLNQRTAAALPQIERLRAASKALTVLLASDRYFSRSDVKAWRQDHATDNLPFGLDLDDLELSQSVHDMILQLRKALPALPNLVDAHNDRFVTRELNRHKELFDGIESNPLTERQRLAAIRNEDRNLVVAGAGTGKTSCVVARVAYLVERGLAKPAEILVLAYAREAQKELEERIAARIGMRIEVRTFHSLGMAILGEATGRVPTVSKAATDPQELDRRLTRYLDETLADDRTRQAVVEFFSHHLTPPEPTDTFKTANEHYRYLKAHGIRTLDGVLVKSQQEQQIANWLLLHGIQYVYEEPYAAADTADREHRAYEPDFYLPEHDIYIEHFGVDRKGTTASWVDRPAYHEGMRWKRALHAEQGTDLIETFSYQFAEGTIFRDLQAALEQLEVEVKPLSVEQVRALILKSPDATPFIGLVKTFLSLYCCSGLQMKDLQARAATSAHPQRARVFLEVFEDLVDRYRRELQAEPAIDFSDMIRLATAAVTKGTYRSPFRHIIVDEFQDIAIDRADLVCALLGQVPHSRLLAVGDDWQSIYRFSGSDVSIMTLFEMNFGATARTDLDLTFRYPEGILKTASRFITRNPEQLKKELTSPRKEPVSPIRIRWCRSETRGDVLVRVLQEIAANTGSKPASVMLLGRYHHCFDELPSFTGDRYAQLSIQKRTVHGSKGLEADYVVVLDLLASRYGFPTERADDPLLDLVRGPTVSFPHAEERRLFYVAMTRAKRVAFLLADEPSPSPFVTELMGPDFRGQVEVTSTGMTPATCPVCSGPLVQRRGAQNKVFWGCSNYPYCKGKGRSCPSCDGVVQRQYHQVSCNRIGCDFTAQACPRCTKGHLVERKGRYGRFWGCSIYPVCDFVK